MNYVVAETSFSNYTVHSSTLADALHLPPECDVSLRRGWFWHPDDKPKELDHLLAIYYRSIGLGPNLLANPPPDTRGLIPNEDVARLGEFSAEVRRRFQTPLAASQGAVAAGTVGSQRIHVLEPVKAATLVIRLEGRDPVLTAVTAFSTGVGSVPEINYLATTEAPG